ncbi:c-type cytochrome [Crenothrix sp.]|uniref:c-type cytochrome n=1 Tax=Crenothrix sp. TaxID=3100433 RepID=UPI00374D8E87
MKKKLLGLSLSLAFVSAPCILHAEGNTNAGKDKTASCQGCHGENGNSSAPTFPKLAGQHASYLEKQLYAFKDGSRNNAMMSAIASALTDQDIADIAEYYASKKISVNGAPSLPPDDDDDTQKPTMPKLTMPELLSAGSNIYRNGDIVHEVSACIACHGPNGEGNKPAAFPTLQSQHADYLIQTLTDFKNGVRSTNPDNMMAMIAKKMTDEQIKAVSYQLSTMK